MTAGTSGNLVTTTVQLEPEQITKLNLTARERRTSRSAVVRQCIDEAIPDQDRAVVQAENGKEGPSANVA